MTSRFPWLAWLRWSFGGKKRNKKTLELLRLRHRQAKPAAELLAEFDLTPPETAFLYDRGMVPEGWRPLAEAPPLAPERLFHLAALGLIFLSGLPRGRVYLADAGRFLLVLTPYRPLPPTAVGVAPSGLH